MRVYNIAVCYINSEIEMYGIYCMGGVMITKNIFCCRKYKKTLKKE